MGVQRAGVAGSFIHLIDRTTEPTDAGLRPSHLRVVEE
jgi:hypothetical protein